RRCQSCHCLGFPGQNEVQTDRSAAITRDDLFAHGPDAIHTRAIAEEIVSSEDAVADVARHMPHAIRCEKTPPRWKHTRVEAMEKAEHLPRSDSARYYQLR